MVPDSGAGGSASLQLPTLIVSSGDVARLQRELESLEDFLHQAALRRGGEAVKLPRPSRLLDELSGLNRLNLIHQSDRDRARQFLAHLQSVAPVLHISFASDPSAAFIDKLVIWLRGNINPLLLMSVGLQPTIAAGCVIRTSNHQFDFSLRRRFDEQRALLLDKLNAGSPQR